MTRTVDRPARQGCLHVGVADHLGWAVVVTVDDELDVVDRRRIALVDDDLPAAPIHHVGGPHVLHHGGTTITNEALTELVARVRASAAATIDVGLDQLTAELAAPVASLSLRDWPPNMPAEIELLRRAPWESKADPVMYRRLLSAAAESRGWIVHRVVAATIEADARELLGAASADVLQAPRATLGPPWTKDHRLAYAAAVCAARG